MKSIMQKMDLNTAKKKHGTKHRCMFVENSYTTHYILLVVSSSHITFNTTIILIL